METRNRARLLSFLRDTPAPRGSCHGTTIIAGRSIAALHPDDLQAVAVRVQPDAAKAVIGPEAYSLRDAAGNTLAAATFG